MLKVRDYLFFIIWIHDYVIYLEGELLCLERVLGSEEWPFKDENMSKMKEYEHLRSLQRFYISILSFNQLLSTSDPQYISYINSRKPRVLRPRYRNIYNLLTPYHLLTP